MVKTFKRLLCLQFKLLEYGKIEWYCGISLTNITLLFPLYVRCPSTILKFLQDFLKLPLFSFIFRYIFWIIFTSNKVFCFPEAIFLKFIFNQKENRGFIWPKLSSFYFKNIRFFLFRKKRCSLKIVVPEFF